MMLSRERVLSLSADELRVSIAQELGWKWHKWEERPGEWVEMLRKDENFNYGAARKDGRLQFMELPDWPGDIRAAWELAEDAQIVAIPTISRDTGDITGWLARGDAGIYYPVSEDGWYEEKISCFVPGDTAQLAIARAWYLVRAEGG